MKIATSNPNPIDVDDHRAHRCNVCGSVKYWTKAHRHVERPVGSGYQAYEVYFVTCSDECRADARDIFIEWLSNYDGWDIQSATENYDKYVKNDTDSSNSVLAS